jgi:hypothetical protein
MSPVLLRDALAPSRRSGVVWERAVESEGGGIRETVDVSLILRENP